MHKSNLTKNIVLIFCIALICGILMQNSIVDGQTSTNSYLKVGDQISYQFTSTGAFIPYADKPFHIEITNVSDSSNILVNILYGDSDINEAISLNTSVSADWYILSNVSISTNYLICPIQNNSVSKIQEFWTSENLNLIQEYYFEVERNALELEYNYETEFHGDNYSLSIRWLWDLQTGVLLNNSVQFINIFDNSLSGNYEQYLVSTTLWELSTRIVPGYSTPLTLLVIGITLVTIFLIIKGKIKLSNRKLLKKHLKFLSIALLFISSTYFLLPVIPSVQALPARTMPGADVLILTNNTDSVIATSLGLDNTFSYSLYIEGTNSTDDLLSLDYNLYDVIIADSYLPDNLTALHKLKSAINGSSHDLGLIFFGGNYSENALLTFSSILPVEFVIDRGVLNATIVEFFIEQTGLPQFSSLTFYSELYKQTQFFEIQTNDVQVSVSDEQKLLSDSEQSIYVSRIAWESCPLLYERILTYAKKPSATTLIEVPDTKEPLVVTWEHDWDADNISSQVIYVSPGVATIWDYQMGENDQWNTPFHLWPYFNYFLYMMVYDIKGLESEEIESYADWPWSPIPHTKEAIIWMVFVGSLWVFNFTLFFVLRRKSKNRDLAKDDSSPNLEKYEDNQPEDTKDG